MSDDDKLLPVKLWLSGARSYSAQLLDMLADLPFDGPEYRAVLEARQKCDAWMRSEAESMESQMRLENATRLYPV